MTDQCDHRWTDPVSALWILTYLLQDQRSFVDGYLRRRYQREHDGNVKIVLLSRLMERNKADNLAFIIDRLPEVLRIGKEGDRPGALALMYLQHTVMVEYKCDDKKFPTDNAYRSWVRDLYLAWYREAVKTGIRYDNARRAFISRSDRSESMDAHLQWASDCLAETYRDIHGER